MQDTIVMKKDNDNRVPSAECRVQSAMHFGWAFKVEKQGAVTLQNKKMSLVICFL